MRIICWLKTIKYTLKRFISTGEINAYVSGHDYVLQDSYIKDGKIYEPLKCEVCGHVSEAWRKL